jgi:DNA-binding transcriptional LysR family regulator
MSKLPDFEGIAMFAKVAEERSYAAAARSLNVSVATVSRAVARLEERLGGRLFNRTSRRLALTDFGQRLAERASRVFAEAEEVEAGAREMSSTPRGLVRLACPMSFGLRWIAPLMPKFLRAYPEVSIDLHLSDAHTDLIGEGFDAALRIAILEDSSLVARRICPIRRLIVASPSYIQTFGHPMHPHDLATHRCVSYAYRAREVWRLLNAAGEEHSVTPSGPLRVTNIEAAIPALLDGLAIAELPDFIAGEHLASGRVVHLLPEWESASGALYFVTPSARARPAKVEALANFFVKSLSEPMWPFAASPRPSRPGPRKAQ